MCLVILFLQDIMYFEQVVFFTHIPEKKVDILVRTNLKYTQTKCTHFRPFFLVVVYFASFLSKVATRFWVLAGTTPLLFGRDPMESWDWGRAGRAPEHFFVRRLYCSSDQSEVQKHPGCSNEQK